MIRVGADLPRDEVLALYGANGWTVYTDEPDRLMRAIAGSSRVVTAWDGERLVGLARVVTDGESVAYLQDVLVHPDCQGQGLGRRLAEEVFAPYGHVRQRVLLTDGTPRQRAFYEALGFVEVRDHAPPLAAYVRFAKKS